MSFGSRPPPSPARPWIRSCKPSGAMSPTPRSRSIIRARTSKAISSTSCARPRKTSPKPPAPPPAAASPLTCGATPNPRPPPKKFLTALPSPPSASRSRPPPRTKAPRKSTRPSCNPSRKTPALPRPDRARSRAPNFRARARRLGPGQRQALLAPRRPGRSQALANIVQRILAIARLTWKSAFRYRLFWIMAALLLVSVIGLPLLIKDDGTAKGLAQILLTYSLSSITALLAFFTLWLACGTWPRTSRNARCR